MIHYHLDETSDMLDIPNLSVRSDVSPHRVVVPSCLQDTERGLVSQAVRPCETFDTASVSLLILHWLLLLQVATAILEQGVSLPLL